MARLSTCRNAQPLRSRGFRTNDVNHPFTGPPPASRGRIVSPLSPCLRCPGTCSEAGQHTNQCRVVYAVLAATRQSIVLDPTAAAVQPTAKFAVTYASVSLPRPRPPSSVRSTPVQDPDDVRADHGQGRIASPDRDPRSRWTSYGWNCSGLMCIDAIATKKAGHQLDAAPDIASPTSAATSRTGGSGPVRHQSGKYDFSPSSRTNSATASASRPRVTSPADSAGSVQMSGLNTASRPGDQARSPSTSALLWKMPELRQTLANARPATRSYFDKCQGAGREWIEGGWLVCPVHVAPGQQLLALTRRPSQGECELVDDLHAISDGETIRTPGPVAVWRC